MNCMGATESTIKTNDRLPNMTEENQTTDQSTMMQNTNTETNLSSDASGDYSHSRTVMKSASDQGSELAYKAVTEIESDKKEALHIIANYAIDPLEMLHLVDRWLQQLLGEFVQQRNHFKYKLKEKWENNQLFIDLENNSKVRKVYNNVKELQSTLADVLTPSSFEQMNDFMTNIEYEKQNIEKLKEKFNESSEKYLRIMDSLDYIYREANVNNNHIRSMRNILLNLKGLNDKITHTICIIGLEKAGKSTFINALVGFALLPTASERCTQIRTVLKPRSQSYLQRCATVTFYDDSEFKFYFDKMVRKTDETHDQFEKRKREVLETHESLKSKGLQEHFDTNMQEMRSCEVEWTKIIGQLHNYIKGELYVNIIKEISIYTDKLPGENYELLDVPGFDSPIKEHREAGLHAIATADAFLFLTNGQSPSLTESEICLLNEIQTHHFEAMQRAFAIVTKLDLCLTSTIYQDHLNKAKDELLDKRFSSERIFAACSRIELLDNQSDEYGVIDEKLRRFDGLKDGFGLVKNTLNQFIQYELPKTHLKQLIDFGKTRLLRLVTDGLEIVRQKQLLPENLAVMSLEDFIKVQNTENWDQYYDEKRFKPTFANANHWHTTKIIRERPIFIKETEDKFHEYFLELTREFMLPQESIEKLMYNTYSYTKLQLNPHPHDNTQREELSFKLESIVDKASHDLAQYFYDNYVVELENILNEISPEEKTLYRTKLSREKCEYEMHALIMRVCRPVIMATIRYSRYDFYCKNDAINELIYTAPIVAYKIVNERDKNSDGQLPLMLQNAARNLLKDGNGTFQKLIEAIFSRQL